MLRLLQNFGKLLGHVGIPVGLTETISNLLLFARMYLCASKRALKLGDVCANLIRKL